MLPFYDACWCFFFDLCGVASFDQRTNCRLRRSAAADPGFSPGGAPTPKIAIIFQIFAENCMKMKEFGLGGGGARPWRSPWIRQWSVG